MQNLLTSAAFLKIRDERYPLALHAVDVRHRQYERELGVYKHAAEQAYQAVWRKVVRPAQERHPTRFVCELDGYPRLTKSPRSIDDKIFRYLSGRGVAGEKPTQSLLSRLRDRKADPDHFLKLFFRQLPAIMNDLARFRIVGNFLSDVNALKDAFNDDRLDVHGVAVDPNIEDRIEADRWESGASGHRAVHVGLSVEIDGFQVPIEVQIMTSMEKSWDQKSHLLYEVVRQGGAERVSKSIRLQVRAMSDTLYVADALFDRVFCDEFPDEMERHKP